MIGILLGGGSGTRLFPITKVVNKHILPVYDKPMLYYPLQTLIDSGVINIIIVCGKPFDKQIKTIIKEFPNIDKISYSFVVQPHPSGMADAIMHCKNKVGNKSIIVVAGDNIYAHNLKKEVTSFKTGALSFLRQVDNPERFAVPIYRNKNLVRIDEKPTKPKANWVVTGPHFFDNQVFSLVELLSPSKRGELEITDLNNEYLRLGQLQLKKKRGWWIDAGTYNSLLQAGIDVKRRRNQL